MKFWGIARELVSRYFCSWGVVVLEDLVTEVRKIE
jgi:hypothetical protein